MSAFQATVDGFFFPLPLHCLFQPSYQLGTFFEKRFVRRPSTRQELEQDYPVAVHVPFGRGSPSLPFHGLYKSWLASSSSSQQAADAVCSGLEALNQLYGSMKQFLASPQTLQALSNSQHEKWVAEMIQGSILCRICQMRECTTELQSALRRKKGNEVIDIESHVEVYAGFRKNMKKGMERSLTELKQIESKSKSAGCFPHIQQTTSSSHLLNVVRGLSEASSATNLMFQSLVLFLSMPVMPVIFSSCTRCRTLHSL
uniref:Uncharacterized protein n=1 Tax=Kalanchoe fedtschenkoi TaxID=63787 RepID=A0A7N0VLC4_KALFE